MSTSQKLSKEIFFDGMVSSIIKAAGIWFGENMIKWKHEHYV